MKLLFFFFKQKTAYEMRISDWSSDVCSSDLKFDADGRRSTRTSDRSGYGRPLARLIWHGLLPSPQRPQSVAPSNPRQEGRPAQMLGRLQPGTRLVRAPQPQNQSQHPRPDGRTRARQVAPAGPPYPLRIRPTTTPP